MSLDSTVVTDIKPGSTHPNVEPAFFPVSLTKLVVMSIVTFGFYQIFWFYKNWAWIKQHTGMDITPGARAFFAPFFCRALFKEIKGYAGKAGLHPGFNPLGLAIAFFVLTYMWRLPDPYALIAYLSVLTLLPIQNTVNELNSIAAPGHNPNARFTAWNIVGVVLGTLCLLGYVASCFFPAPIA